MVWYYADGDRQRGPISDEEFQELVSNGRIRRETLIWKDGMDNWQPLETARSAGIVTIVPAAPAPPDKFPVSDAPSQGVDTNVPRSPESDHCTQCARGPLGMYDVVKLGNLNLCRDCDTDLANHYRAGQTAASPPAPSAPWAPASQPYEAAAPDHQTFVLAGIPARALAKIIDNLVYMLVVLFVMILTVDMSTLTDAFTAYRADPETVTEIARLMQPAVLAGLIFGVLYNGLLVAFFGATLGKMAMGIRVIMADGSPARMNAAFLRAVAPALIQLPGVLLPAAATLANITNLILMFSFAIALADVQRRTLFDHAAGTRVIKN